MTNPFYVLSADGEGKSLISHRERAGVKGDSLPYKEDWLQTFLAQHPEVLPVREFGPWEFDQPICVARELRTGESLISLDLLFLSYHACPILVEVKRFDNREQYRDVVGQLLEYAADLSKWDIKRLDEGIRAAAAHEKRRAPGVNSIEDCVRRLADLYAGEHGQVPDDFIPRFYQKLQRNLDDGRFLLLIVGDGIRDSLIPISEMLNRPAQRVLGFSFGLVELGIYPTDPSSPWPAVVVPSVVEQVRASERVTIRVRYEGQKPEVSVAEAELERPRRRGRLESIDAFIRTLEDDRGADVADTGRMLLTAIEEAGFHIDLGEANANIRYFDSEGHRYFLFDLLPAGELWFRDLFLNKSLKRTFGTEKASEVFSAATKAFLDTVSKGNVPVQNLAKSFKVDLASLDEPRQGVVVEGLTNLVAEINRAVENQDLGGKG